MRATGRAGEARAGGDVEGSGGGRVWRDLGLEGLMSGGGRSGSGNVGSSGAGGARREGGKKIVLLR